MVKKPLSFRFVARPGPVSACFCTVLICANLCCSANQPARMPDARSLLEAYARSDDWRTRAAYDLLVEAEGHTLTASGEETDRRGNRTSLKVYEHDGRVDWRGETRLLDAPDETPPARIQKISGALLPDGTPYWLDVHYMGSREPAYASVSVKDNEQRRRDFRVAFDGPLDGRIGGQGFQTVSELLLKSDLSPVREEVLQGVSAYRLEGKTPFGTVRAWISPDQGSQAIQYEIIKTVSDLYEDKPIGQIKDDSGIHMVRWVARHHTTKMDRIGTHHVPSEGEYEQVVTLSDGRQLMSRIRMRRTAIDLSPDFSKAGAFVPNLPEGTRIKNADVAGVEHVWRGGTFRVKSTAASR